MRGFLLVSVLSLLLHITGLCNAGLTSSFVRKTHASVDMPVKLFSPPPGYNAPEQVHITQGDLDGRGVIISWVTPLKRHPSTVAIWEAHSHSQNNHNHRKIIHAKTTSYKYYNYTSGYIHHATVKNLKYNTKYIYELGKGDAQRRFFFTTPPEVGPDASYTFGIIVIHANVLNVKGMVNCECKRDGELRTWSNVDGDLGQTYDSNQTFHHYHSNPKGQAVLFAGDLSYADNHLFHDNVRWDTWGRFIEKNAAYQAWIFAPGNHELDYAPEIGEYVPFKPYKHRYHVPYRASNSTSPLWYSIKRASAHIIVLSSYSAYGKYTPQYSWLEEELLKVNRSKTPWLIVVLHCPWYNSNNYHYMEGESMRVEFEPWFVQHKVDLVLSGHVHSYERSERVSNVRYNITNGESMPVRDPRAPVYITIGDGGNIEGLANDFMDPQPSYSAYREASFGHAMLEIKNRTHAYYTWHRNQDNEAVASDSIWFYNRYWYPEEEHSSHRV
ncbi:hypothetical protein LguiA_005763 [Lonicera macranthoides]